MQTALLFTTLAGLSTALGGLITALFPPTPRLLAASAGFAAGVMLTVSLADLAPEALAFYAQRLPPPACGAAVCGQLLCGMAAAAFLGRLLPEESVLARRLHLEHEGETSRPAALRAALVTGAALLLHNLPEGVLTLFAGAADPRLGLRTALAIALHNIPEGLAVAVPFAYATRSRARGVLAALASGLAEPLGAALAWLFLRGLLTPALLNGTVVLVAGVMLWVAIEQLLPAAKGMAGHIGAAAGCLLMLLGIAALP